MGSVWLVGSRFSHTVLSLFLPRCVHKYSYTAIWPTRSVNLNSYERKSKRAKRKIRKWVTKLKKNQKKLWIWFHSHNKSHKTQLKPTPYSNSSYTFTTTNKLLYIHYKYRTVFVNICFVRITSNLIASIILFYFQNECRIHMHTPPNSSRTNTNRRSVLATHTSIQKKKYWDWVSYSRQVHSSGYATTMCVD